LDTLRSLALHAFTAFESVGQGVVDTAVIVFAAINSTRVVVIAVDRVAADAGPIDTRFSRIASLASTGCPVENVFVLTPVLSIATVSRTQIGVIARNRNIGAAINNITAICGAGIIVVTIERDPDLTHSALA